MPFAPLPRSFNLNGTIIDDSTPHLPLQEAIRNLSKTYPHFRHTRVYEEDGVVKDGKIVYTLELPPSKSNG